MTGEWAFHMRASSPMFGGVDPVPLSEREHVLPRIITKLVGWAVAVFYDLARTGPHLPDGPVLVVANHPNALVDPLVIFRTAGRATRPLARAPLFEQAMVGTVLRGLGGLPVYRKQDHPDLMHLNDTTFDAAIEALHAGGAVQIYPEGQSHSGPAMTPLRTGAARIALLAEERRGWSLGLKIQPVGLTYTRKHLFRGRAAAIYGDPFEVAPFREAYERDEREAVRALTAEIQDRLEGVTINFELPEDEELVDVAERVYASHKRITRPRDRPHVVERLPRLQRFADGIRWLRATDPEQLRRLQNDVRRYLRLLTIFGASEGDIPARFKLGRVVPYMIRQTLMLLLVLPVAAVGAVAWWVPYLATVYVPPRFKPKLDQIATYKLGAAMLAFPLWYAMVLASVFFAWGLRTVIVVAVAMPIAGLALVAWRDRQATVSEDLRVFRRAARRSEVRDRLREIRAELVAEVDALTDAWRVDRATRARGKGTAGRTERL